MKNKITKYHTVEETILKSSRKIGSTEAKSITPTHIHDRSLPWLGTCISITKKQETNLPFDMIDLHNENDNSKIILTP